MTILIILYFFVPLIISILPGILREERYGDPINDTISLICFFCGSILFGMLFSWSGVDTLLASISRLLIITLLLAPLPPCQTLMASVQQHIHLIPQRRRV